jgi:hypothetical protein
MNFLVPAASTTLFNLARTLAKNAGGLVAQHSPVPPGGSHASNAKRR